MSAFRYIPGSFGSSNSDDRESPQRSFSEATAIKLRRSIPDAQTGVARPKVCSQCLGPQNPRNSDGEYAKVFCSLECEQEFLTTAFASLTVEDCIRIQQRLEGLLLIADTPELEF